jgi:hypothetical protein
LIKRVETLEREMRTVRAKLTAGGDSGKSSRDFIGMFQNDQDFLEAMKLGRAYRRAFRPNGQRPKRARKK